MNTSLFQVIATLFIVGASITVFVARQKYMAASSERRMLSMLDRVGLDPAIASSGEPDTIFDCMIETTMKEVRQRCRACSTVNECERWLAGNEESDNVFCPNAKVFKALKIIRDDITNDEHTVAV